MGAGRGWLGPRRLVQDEGIVFKDPYRYPSSSPTSGPGIMAKAYSYTRFSTPEQAKGDSRRRQTALAREYAERNGLDLDETLTYHDAGVSAFRGKNVRAAEGSGRGRPTRKLGALRAFLDHVETGEVEAGSYLLVENLDRISRQQVWDAVQTLGAIVQADITVVTLKPERILSRDTLNREPFLLVEVVLTFIRSGEESVTKGLRLRQAWQLKRATAREKPVTSLGPGWLRFDHVHRRFVKDPERAKVVRRIFRDTLRGHGAHRIAEALNAEGVPTFGRSQFWRRAYVRTILENPAVIGTLVPKTTEYDDAGIRQRHKQHDATVEGYYPAVIDAETYRRAQALRQGSGTPLRGRHARGEVVNLFGGIGRCGRCGATLVLTSKGNGGVKRRYVVCEKAKSSAGCRYQAWRYETIEYGFLSNAPWLLAQIPAAGEVGEEIAADAQRIEGELFALSEALENLMRGLEAGRSVTLAARIRDVEEERERLSQEYAELQERRESATGQHVKTLAGELRDVLTADPLDRTAANALIRQVFATVTLDYASGSLVFAWKHGGTSDLMVHWPSDD